MALPFEAQKCAGIVSRRGDCRLEVPGSFLRVSGTYCREAQETNAHPTRKPPSPVCCFHTGLRFTRTGGRIGTCQTARRFSGRSSAESSSMATPPKPRSRTRARLAPWLAENGVGIRAGHRKRARPCAGRQKRAKGPGRGPRRPVRKVQGRLQRRSILFFRWRAALRSKSVAVGKRSAPERELPASQEQARAQARGAVVVLLWFACFRRLEALSAMRIN